MSMSVLKWLSLIFFPVPVSLLTFFCMFDVCMFFFPILYFVYLFTVYACYINLLAILIFAFSCCLACLFEPMHYCIHASLLHYHPTPPIYMCGWWLAVYSDVNRVWTKKNNTPSFKQYLTNPRSSDVFNVWRWPECLIRTRKSCVNEMLTSGNVKIDFKIVQIIEFILKNIMHFKFTLNSNFIQS